MHMHRYYLDLETGDAFEECFDVTEIQLKRRLIPDGPARPRRIFRRISLEEKLLSEPEPISLPVARKEG